MFIWCLFDYDYYKKFFFFFFFFIVYLIIIITTIIIINLNANNINKSKLINQLSVTDFDYEIMACKTWAL